MKKTLILLYATMMFISCGNNGVRSDTSSDKKVKASLPQSEGPRLTMSNKKLSFGKINKKKKQFVTLDFEFVNSGNKPLIILKVDFSCGCFSAEYPKQPIKKGEKGIIKIKTDLKTQKGDFNKSIFVKTNSINNVELLRIVGKVK